MKRALVPADLEALVLASDPQLALAPERIVACVATFDRERDAIVRHLRVFAHDTSRALSAGPHDHAPVLSPDARTVAFVRGSARAHLAIVPLEGTAPVRTLGDARDAIAEPAWSPDGRQIAFTALAQLPPDAAAIARDPATGAQHVRLGPFKDDARGLLDGRTRALFVLDVTTGRARQLVACGDDIAAPAWSPDGTAIAYARRACGRFARMCGTIELVDLASGAVRAVSAGDGPAYAPVFSPDGRTIAFAGHRHGDDNRYGCEAFVVPVGGGEPRSITRDLDRPVGNVLVGDVRSGTAPRLAWMRDGRAVAMLVTDGGTCNVVAVAIEDETVGTLAGGARDIAGFALAADGSLAIAYATPLEPSVLAVVTPDGRERRVAALNPWLDACALIAPEPLALTSDEMPIDAWLMRPLAAERAAPLVLAVHPGPHAAYGWTFVLEYQILAACGIGVVFGNQRGSLGYGAAFGLASTGDWGGGDARDLHAIVDAALARGGFDAQRLACIGQSYGGFMTTWLLGHGTRFATGISLDAVNDLAGLYGASDVGWSMETELGVEVARDAGCALFERSALRAAGAITAPLLIVHGACDARCPIDQAEQLYTALRYLGRCEVEFVRLLGGTHELSRSGNPRERVLRLRTIANWLVRHLHAAVDAPAPAGWLFAPLAGEDARSARVEASQP